MDTSTPQSLHAATVATPDPYVTALDAASDALGIAIRSCLEGRGTWRRFVSTGKNTGHRYMLTSRNAPDQLQHFGSRCLFDLDENRAYCVHDWDVPAEEELLALHCLLSLPGHETWARAMPDLGGSHEGASADLDLLLAGV